MPSPDVSAPRLVTIDAVRGFAVLGILAMNIVAMGMPLYAYVDPRYYGGATGADLAAWGIAYVAVDGKMRALFTMLFGASMALIADTADRPAWLHYRRMGVLFLIGMVHAWGLWFGDILVEYALVGCLLFIGLRWRVSALLFVATLCLALTLADDLLTWSQLSAVKAAAESGDAEAAARWADVLAATRPDHAAIAREIALYRGGFADAFAARAPATWMFQTLLLPLTFAETLGFAAFGLALHRLRFFSGEWRARSYGCVVATGGAALLLYLPIARMLAATGFDPATIPLADGLGLLLRPWLALGYSAAIILLVRGHAAPRLIARVAAAGRMALSNYLGSTLIATTLFYGYGLGLYGRLHRAELYWVALLIWATILLWSKPWLDRFAYGPLEWLWRAASRGTLPTFRRG